METNTTLRQAFNEVYIEGILKEKNIKQSDIEMEIEGGIKVKSKVITGHFVIKTEEDNEVKVFVNAKQYTRKGNENIVYKGMETVMNGFVSMVESVDICGNPSLATKVVVKRGQIAERIFTNDNGETIAYRAINTNFIEEQKKPLSPRTEFECDIYFEEFKEELDQNKVPTGNMEVEAVLPLFGGRVMPLTLLVKDKAIMEHFKKYYSTGRTGRVNGNIETIVTRIESNASGIGTQRVKVFEKIKQNYIITGANEFQYDINDINSFNPDTLKMALQERLNYIESQKVKEVVNNNPVKEKRELDF